MKTYTYEDCRDIVRGWGLEKLTTLITLHHKVLEQMKIVGAPEAEVQNQDHFVLAMEDELADQVGMCEEFWLPEARS